MLSLQVFAADLRIWEIDSKRVEAQFWNMEKGRVEFRLANSTKIKSCSLKDLSNEDVFYLVKHHLNKKAAFQLAGQRYVLDKDGRIILRGKTSIKVIGTVTDVITENLLVVKTTKRSYAVSNAMVYKKDQAFSSYCKLINNEKIEFNGMSMNQIQELNFLKRKAFDKQLGENPLRLGAIFTGSTKAYRQWKKKEDFSEKRLSKEEKITDTVKKREKARQDKIEDRAEAKNETRIAKLESKLDDLKFQETKLKNQYDSLSRKKRKKRSQIKDKISAVKKQIKGVKSQIAELKD